MHDPSIKLLMFDLDGTLIDTMFKFADLAAEIMERELGVPFAEARAGYLGTSGIPFAQQLEVMHAGNAKNAPISDEFEERKKLITRSTPMDHPTRVALRDLVELGCNVVLSSNTSQTFVNEFVADEEFRFDLALGYDADAAMAKGRPHVQRTLQEFPVEASEIVFVGDSFKDSELAAENGLRFVGRVGTNDLSQWASYDPKLPLVREMSELVEWVHSEIRSSRKRITV